MKYFEASNISEFKLERLAGPQIKSPLKGSPGLFIQACRAIDPPIDFVGARANFEIRQHGLLMYVSKSSKRWVIAIPTGEIIKVALTGADLSIDPFPFKPMTMFLDTKNLDVALTVSGANDGTLWRFAKRVEQLIPGQQHS